MGYQKPFAMQSLNWFCKIRLRNAPKSAYLRKIDWKGALNQAVIEKYWPIGRLNA